MTLAEMRQQYEDGKLAHSRFHKTSCRYCGKPITNQAMGRKAHMEACKQRFAEDQYLKGKAQL